MLTIDSALQTAMLAGTGVPIVRLRALRLSQWPTVSYNPVHLYLTPTRYRSTRLKLSVWFEQDVYTEQNNWIAYDRAQTVIQAFVFSLERGVKIGETEYTIFSPFWYPSAYFQDKKNNLSRVDFLAWDTSRYLKSSAADQSAADVIADLMSDYSTAIFRNTTIHPWSTYQFDRTGSNLHPLSFNGLLPMLWNRYTVKMFPRQNGEVLFSSKVYDQTEDDNISIPTTLDTTRGNHVYHVDPTPPQTLFEIKEFQKWNIFWEDETGATHRLSATYPELLNYPIRNTGFLPSTANTAYIKALLSDNILAYSSAGYNVNAESIIRPDFRIEQGDLVQSYDWSTGTRIASVTEEYNMNGTIYPWQMRVKMENMHYGIYPEQ